MRHVFKDITLEEALKKASEFGNPYVTWHTLGDPANFQENVKVGKIIKTAVTNVAVGIIPQYYVGVSVSDKQEDDFINTDNDMTDEEWTMDTEGQVMQ